MNYDKPFFYQHPEFQGIKVRFEPNVKEDTFKVFIKRNGIERTTTSDNKVWNDAVYFGTPITEQEYKKD